MSMTLKVHATCGPCDQEGPNGRPRLTRRDASGAIRCARCNHLIGQEVEMEVIESHSGLLELLCERNAFEITEFGRADGLPYVQLESRANHAIVRIDWRYFKPEEYDVTAEEGSMANRFERNRVAVDEVRLQALPPILKSAIDTVRRQCIPVQASITDTRGQIRFRDLTSMRGAGGQHLWGVVRVQFNWAFGVAIVSEPDTAS